MVFERVKTGIVLTKDSLLLIRHHPTLALFPLVGGGAGLVFLGLFLGITLGLLAITPEGVALVMMFIAYFTLTFISTFFTAGLVHETKRVMEDEEPSLRAGIDGAWEVKGPLLVWALISATVGVIINVIENSDSRLAQMFGAIFGLAWTLLTFFVIPVIVFEKPSVRGMFERSAGMFRETWGETPISLIGVQLVSGIVLLPFMIPGVYLFSIGIVVPAIVLILLGIGASFVLGQSLQGVVKTILYVYASTGKKPGEFDDVDFDKLATGPAKKEESFTVPPIGGTR